MRPPEPFKQPHRIAKNTNLRILLLGHIDDLNAVVITAVLANAVGQLLFVALGALDDAGQLQLPVSATLTATGLGHFSLGKSHGYTSSFCYPSERASKIVRLREPVSGENCSKRAANATAFRICPGQSANSLPGTLLLRLCIQMHYHNVTISYYMMVLMLCQAFSAVL